ncbi:hypothetical protein YC2023_082151 [Brassica napus]
MKQPPPGLPKEFKMDLLPIQQAQEPTKWPRKVKAMIHFTKPVKPVLDLPYWKAHWFNQLQTRNWRPGDSSKRPEEFNIILTCTSSHRIKMNPLFINLPYMDAFTLGVIEDQRLLPLLLRHEVDTIQTSNEIPRTHFFLLKLTRYKAQASGLIKGILPQPFVATIDPFKLDNSCCLVI